MRGWLLALAFAIGVPADAFAKDTVVVKLRDKKPAAKTKAAVKKKPARAAKRKPSRRKPVAKAKPKSKSKPVADRPRPMP